jgi:Lsr2
MAQKIAVHIECDVPEGHKGDVETVSFGYDGDTYELELCSKHRVPLEKVMDALVPLSRRVSLSGRRSASKSRRPAATREQSTAIRAWAKENGIKVSERGRIPATVIAQYQAAR